MFLHSQTGLEGEEAAARYMISKGYHLIERNWRFKHLETDLIMSRLGLLVFIEVKTLSHEGQSNPLIHVNKEKVVHLLNAAHAYMRTNQLDAPVRFDIISVIKDGNCYKVNHYPDAFDMFDKSSSKEQSCNFK